MRKNCKVAVHLDLRVLVLICTELDFYVRKMCFSVFYFSASIGLCGTHNDTLAECKALF